MAEAGTRLRTSSRETNRIFRFASTRNTAGKAIPPFSPSLNTPHDLTTSRRTSQSMGNGSFNSCLTVSERWGSSTAIAATSPPPSRIFLY